MKSFIRKHVLLGGVMLASVVTGLAVYGWQSSQQHTLMQDNSVLRARIAHQEQQLHPTSRQPNLKDQDALTRLARADYLADPAHKTAPTVKINKVLANFALLTVTKGNESYKVVAKKVATDWVIVIKGMILPPEDIQRFDIPAKLLES